MAISGITKQQYDDFKKNGGTIIVIVDAEDICWQKNFEQFPSIQPCLTTGFELRPDSLIQSSELLAHIFTKPGNDWDCLLAIVYLSGGKVIYKKLPGGNYEATCSFLKCV